MSAIAVPRPSVSRAASIHLDKSVLSIDQQNAVLDHFRTEREDPNNAIAVAGIKALTGLLKSSTASTVHSMMDELDHAAILLKTAASDDSPEALSCGIEIFMNHITRRNKEASDFSVVLAAIVTRAEKYIADCMGSRAAIAKCALPFIRDDTTILVHGSSRVVINILLEASKSFRFQVLQTESRPHCGGFKAAKILKAAGIPVTVIVDSAMGYMMERINFCLVGAEAVAENGGIVNCVGTNTLAYVAKAWNLPFYVAAESYKFARIFPLDQRDFHNTIIKRIKRDDGSEAPGISELTVEMPESDFTPPNLITLMFTDLGVLTPSAVSDELIKMYQ